MLLFSLLVSYGIGALYIALIAFFYLGLIALGIYSFFKNKMNEEVIPAIRIGAAMALLDVVNFILFISP